MRLLSAYTTLDARKLLYYLKTQWAEHHIKKKNKTNNKDPVKFASWTAQLFPKKALFSEYPSQ